MTANYVAVDSRGRVSLAKFNVKPGSYYIFRQEGDRLILDPAVIVNTVTNEVIDLD